MKQYSFSEGPCSTELVCAIDLYIFIIMYPFCVFCLRSILSVGRHEKEILVMELSIVFVSSDNNLVYYLSKWSPVLQNIT